MTRQPEPPAELRRRHPLLPGRQRARLEGRIVFERLVRRTADIESLDDAPDWRGTLILRGVNHLHVRITPSTSSAMREVSDSIAEALPRPPPCSRRGASTGTRMEDIVEATGVPRPTLYYHFSSPKRRSSPGCSNACCVTCPSKSEESSTGTSPAATTGSATSSPPTCSCSPITPNSAPCCSPNWAHHPHPPPRRRDLGGVPRAAGQGPHAANATGPCEPAATR